MKPCLVDVNVLLALLAPRHVHHSSAEEWFARIEAREAGMCRFVQLGVIRLLGNISVMGPGVLSASEAWHAIFELMQDERIEFIPEPTGIDSILPALFRYRVATVNLVADAYLAAFAIASSRKLVTMDRGFRQFHGLELELLNV